MDQLTELYRNKALDLQKKIALLENQLSLVEKRLDDYEAPTTEERKKAEEVATKAREERKKTEEESQKLQARYSEELKKATEAVGAERQKLTGKYDTEDPSVKLDALRRVLFDNPEFAEILPEEEYVKLTGGISKPLVIGKSKTGTMVHQAYEPEEKQKESGVEYKTVAPAYKAYRESMGRQAAERVKEFVTDPEALKAGLALAAASAVAAPVVAVGAAGLGAYSAKQQAEAGYYGAAAIDAALGLLPFAGGRKAFSFKAPGRTRGTFSGEPAPVKPEVSAKPSAEPAAPAWPKVEPVEPFAPKIDSTISFKPRYRLVKGMFGEPKVELIGEPLAPRRPGWTEKRRSGYYVGRQAPEAPPPGPKPAEVPVEVPSKVETVPPEHFGTTSPKPSETPSAAKVAGALAALPGVESAVMAPLPKEIPAVPAIVSRMMGWEKAPTITIKTAEAAPKAPSTTPAKPATPSPKGGGPVAAVAAVPSAPAKAETAAPETAKTKAPAKAPATKAEAEKPVKAETPAKDEKPAPEEPEVVPAEIPAEVVTQVPAQVPAQIKAQEIAAVGGPPELPRKPPQGKTPTPKPPKKGPPPKRPPPSIPFFDSGRGGGEAIQGPRGETARLDLGLAADALGKYSKYYRIA